jgi:mono/diheme cytochrome c family protein
MDATRNGVRRDGKALAPAMPYSFFHNMADADAEAIVAYLRTVPAVDQPFPGLTNPDGGAPLARPEVDAPEDAFDLAYVPTTTLDPSDPNYAAALRGEYIVGYIGVCVDCHTPRVNNQMDLDNLLTGGRGFGPPPNPPTSANLTPHADGLDGWTPEMVRTALKEGIDDEGKRLCAPMPSGPDGALGGLTDEDALAIGYYLTTIEPKANTTGAPYPECSVGDAGAP